MLALLEDWDQKPGKVGAFPITSVPEVWGPSPDQVQPAAFPTPYGRAEAMRRILEKIEAPTSGAEAHPLWRCFDILVTAVTLGELQVEVFDLKRSTEFDNFGTALCRAEPDVRYLAHFYREADDRQVSFGYSHPRCLVWPHARRTEAEWNQLASAVAPRKADALRLLVEFRSVLIAGRRWVPEHPVEWQRGISFLTRGIEPSPDLSTLHEQSRFVGPVGLALPDAAGAPGPSEPVFLPTLSTKFAERFIQWCASAPTEADTPRGRAIVLTDARGTALAELALPRPDGGANLLDLGGGVVTDRAAREIAPCPTYCFEDQDGAQGLPKALDPLALALMQRGRALTSEPIAACPVLYPDPIRILSKRNLWRGGDVRCTARCERVALTPGGAGRLPGTSDAASDPSSFVVVRFTHASMVFAESFEGRDIGDIRALGAALFLAFVGEASVEGGVLRDDDGRPLLRSSALRPLEPDDAAYAATAASPGQGSSYARRLASLQRFVASYETAARSADPGALPLGLAAAARTFAQWARPGADIRPFGRISATGPALDAGGSALSLFVDALA